MEYYENFKPGDRIRVHNRTRLDSEAEGREGTFVEYTKPHRMARVLLDPKPEWLDQSGDLWIVMPESLEWVSDL